MSRACAVLWLVACAPAPGVPDVTVLPEEPHTEHDLVANVADDPGVTWAWYLDDQWVAELVGPRVPASMTARGQVWRAEATDWRGKRPVTGSASVTVRNQPPAVVGLIAPESPEAGDPLVVAAIALDGDDDPTTVTYTWSRDGKPLTGVLGPRIAAGILRRGEIWQVEVRATDGFVGSEPLVLAATVQNAAPELVRGGITPVEPRATDTLTAWAEILDEDGDPVAVTWRWYIGEVLVQSGSTPTLAPGRFVRGHTVRAVAGLDDGAGGVRDLAVGEVVIVNSSPSAPSVVVGPEDPIAGEPLQCTVVSTGSDPDGDSLSVALAWTVDGAPYAGSTTTSVPGDTVPADVTLGEETWRCTARTSDGSAWSPAATSEVQVEYAGFRTSQVIAGRTVTCASVVHNSSWTECTGLRIEGRAFPNGVDCFARWSAAASPHTDFPGFCALVTGSRSFQADYTCGASEVRTTFVAGAWGSRTDNGYAQSIRCGW